MSEKKSYVVEGFDGAFEFSPDGSPFEGRLMMSTDDGVYFDTVKLHKSGSRAMWAREAVKTYPNAFDAAQLEKALHEIGLLRQAEVEAAAAKEEEEASAQANDEVDSELDEEAEKLVTEPGVLDRFVEDMAKIHEVHGDRAQMKTIALSGSSSQLSLLPGGKPVGTNTVIAADAGRGKNYVTDAVASGMPDEWVYTFESASAKSFYYETEQDPGRFEHVWVYANEAEATDALVETLRPLLSGGKAEHKTVNKDSDKGNEFREYRIKGPITATIPTIRNKLDTQLQTRMLVVELEDFEGRVAAHSLKVSDTLLAEYAEKDHGTTLRKWKTALRKLTSVRRVVIPTRDERFKLNSDEVSHGARLWRNFLSLVLTHAWLEQRNREIRALANGERAIVAKAEDYRAAFDAFKAACKRSVVNLSKTHRDILDAVYALQAENDFDDSDTAYSYRKIGERAGCSHQTVKNHRAYLTQSVALLREVDGGGLRLVKDAEPSWWAEGEILEGFPRPEEVAEWWKEGSEGPDDDPTGGRGASASENGLHGLHDENTDQKPDRNGENSANPGGLQTGLHVNPSTANVEGLDDGGLHVKPSSTSEVYTESPIDKAETHSEGGVSSLSTHSENGKHPPTPEDPIRAYLEANAGVFTAEVEGWPAHRDLYPLAKSLACNIANGAFGDSHRWEEAMPAVREKLKELGRELPERQGRPHLTAEQAEEVKRLIGQGMSPEWARREVIGETDL